MCVRIVEGLRGTVAMEMELVIRFDYGSVVPWVERVGSSLLATAGPDRLVLDTPVETHGRRPDDGGEFRGRRLASAFRSCCTTGPRTRRSAAPVDAEQALRDTLDALARMVGALYLSKGAGATRWCVR